MDATIIGGGPIGSYLGYLLSKGGVPNTIVEEHAEIGKPEQCAGLVSRNIEEAIEPSWCRKAVLNKVYGAVISCGRQSLDVRAKEFKAYVFDRSKFDKAIAERAEKEGSEFLLGQSYIGHQKAGKGIKIKLVHKYISSSILIGADGPGSKVAKNSSLFGEREFWTGSQVVLKTKNPFFQKDRVYVFLDKKYSDGFFSWIVPIDDERAKVGLASSARAAEHLQRFLDDKFDDYMIEERHGGVIPMYRKMPLQNKEKNIFLVGDAAMQVKATSGGGIVNGMFAAKGLSEAIISKKFDYEKRIAPIRRNLWLHLMIRKRLNRMDDRMTSELLRMLNQEKTRDVLLEKGDMDFPKKFIFSLLLKQPKLLRFMF